MRRSVHFFVFTISIFWLGPLYPLILRDAVGYTLETHPQIYGRKYSCFASGLQVRQAAARFYPRVDLFADTGPEHAYNNATKATFGGGSNFMRREGNMDVRQIIFDGGFTESTVRQRRAESKFACSQLEESNQMIGFRATEVFVNVIRNRIIVAIYRDDVSSHEQMLQKIIRRTKGGIGRISEVQLSQSRLNLSRSRLLAAEAQLSDAEFNFEEVLGFQPPEDLNLPPLPNVLPQTLETAQEITDLNSPVLTSNRALVEAQRAQVDVSRAAFMPEISFDVTTYHGDDLNGVPGRNVIVNGLLTMNWNLYNGGGDLAQYRTDQALYNESIFNLQDVSRVVQNNVGTAYNFYIINRDRIIALNEHLRDSFNVFESYQKEFEVGQRSLFDLLNSQTEYYRARVERTNGYFDQYVDSYRLLAAMGVLTSFFFGENDICHDDVIVYDDTSVYTGQGMDHGTGIEEMILEDLHQDMSITPEEKKDEEKAEKTETLPIPPLEPDNSSKQDKAVEIESEELDQTEEWEKNNPDDVTKEKNISTDENPEDDKL